MVLRKQYSLKEFWKEVNYTDLAEFLVIFLLFATVSALIKWDIGEREQVFYTVGFIFGVAVFFLEFCLILDIRDRLRAKEQVKK